MGAPDALVAKAEFAETFGRGRDHFDRMAQAFAEEDHDGSLAARFTSSHDLVQAWEQQLSVAEVFYVSPTMCEVIGAAAPTMPPEPLAPSDLPTPDGFVLIPGGVGQINTFGRLMVIHAIL